MKSMYIISRNAEYLKYCMKYLQLKIFKIHVPKTFGTRKRYITRSLSSGLLLALCCEDRYYNFTYYFECCSLHCSEMDCNYRNGFISIYNFVIKFL